MKLAKLAAGAALGIGLMSATSASALWQYTYTGLRVDYADGVYGPLMDRVGIQFTTESKLDLFNSGNPHTLSFKAYDGFQTLEAGAPGIQPWANFYTTVFYGEVLHFWDVGARSSDGTRSISTRSIDGGGSSANYGDDTSYYCPDVWCSREPFGYKALQPEYFQQRAESLWSEVELISPPPPGGVPEPATWAMMIIGFGAAGSMIRRRRAAVA